MSEIENLIVNSAEVAPVEVAPVEVAPVEVAPVESAPVESSVLTGGKKKSKKNVVLDTSVNELDVGAVSLNDTPSVPATPKKSRAKKPVAVATDNVVADGVVVANSEKPLEAKTLSELKEQCKLLGIKGFSKKNKADLIALIKSNSV